MIQTQRCCRDGAIPYESEQLGSWNRDIVTHQTFEPRSCSQARTHYITRPRSSVVAVCMARRLPWLHVYCLWLQRVQWAHCVLPRRLENRGGSERRRLPTLRQRGCSDLTRETSSKPSVTVKSWSQRQDCANRAETAVVVLGAVNSNRQNVLGSPHAAFQMQGSS